MNNFNFNQSNYNYLLIILMLIMGFLMIWKVLSVGDEILEAAPKSKMLNPAGNELKQ
ncbi:MAG: hypothetical protein WAV31_02450 [Candidatus Moraniibacteriota bacterium]